MESATRARMTDMTRTRIQAPAEIKAMEKTAKGTMGRQATIFS